jgi:hypothetical protein
MAVEDERARLGGLLAECLRQSRFANPRFTAEDDGASLSSEHPVELRAKKLLFPGTSYKRRTRDPGSFARRWKVGIRAFHGNPSVP